MGCETRVNNAKGPVICICMYVYVCSYNVFILYILYPLGQKRDVKRDVEHEKNQRICFATFLRVQIYNVKVSKKKSIY